jgi:hypothetical protein
MAVDPIQRAGVLCAGVGFDLDSLKPLVVARLRLLAEHSETLADSERMIARAWDVFHYYEREKPQAAFSEMERRIVVLGCLFSDIGKTGPLAADRAGQTLILEMFAVEGVRDETQSVAQFFARYFPVDAAERVRRFEALGLTPGLSMRAFWNLHSAWTLEIVEAGNVPAEVIAAAATHHLLDNVNPRALVAADRRFTRDSGQNPSFDRTEKLIILLDKYDALRRRAKRSHGQAIEWLKKRVDQNPEFSDDAELGTLIRDLDTALRP